VAISIILGERSIAVIVPVVSLSQTRETVTAWPQRQVGRNSASLEPDEGAQDLLETNLWILS
jgi:hypothetical protein